MEQKEAYVLFATDSGGTFSSNDYPVGVVYSEDDAKEWVKKSVDKYYNPHYTKVPILTK